MIKSRRKKEWTEPWIVIVYDIQVSKVDSYLTNAVVSSIAVFRIGLGKQEANAFPHLIHMMPIYFFIFIFGQNDAIF